MIQPRTVDIELKRPVMVGTEETSVLTMREPTLKDRRIFSALPADPQGYTMGTLLDLARESAQVLCGLTPGEADALGMQDSLAVAEAAVGFIGAPAPAPTSPTP